MITGVKIERLRGVKEGEVQGLTGLSILVGPNGCGKSTVLDALLIGASKPATTGLAAAVARGDGHRWLLWEEGRGGDTKINLHERTATLLRREAASLLVHRGGVPPMHLSIRDGVLRFPPEKTIESGVELVDARSDDALLHELYSDARRAGRTQLALDTLTAVVPGFRGLEVLTEDGKPVLYVTFAERSVPVARSGEGVAVLCRAMLRLSRAEAGGLALLEEPEVHQHPRSLRLMAQGICESVKRGVQIVMTTHSLELIENLLFFASETQILDQTAVHMVRLRDNVLTATKVDGDTARFQIQDIGEDLR